MAAKELFETMGEMRGWIGPAVAVAVQIAGCGGSPSRQDTAGTLVTSLGSMGETDVPPGTETGEADTTGSTSASPTSSDTGTDTSAVSSSSDSGEPNPGCTGLPACQTFNGQSPDCTYTPVIAEPAFAPCSGPIVWIDTTHDNWHQMTPESESQPGRYWGFSSLLFADGFDIRDSETPLDSLTPGSGPDILVIANPYVADPATAVLTDAEANAVAAWVEGGGSLLLVFDHPPFDKISNLLERLGLQRQPAGADTGSNEVFQRSDGTLAAGVFATDGEGGLEIVDEVTTFRGSSFAATAAIPPGIVHTPILTFGPGATATVGGSSVSVAGLLQGAQVQAGTGRAIVVAEAAMLTTQVGGTGTAIGMHQTPQNEQFLLNIMHWLHGAG